MCSSQPMFFNVTVGAFLALLCFLMCCIDVFTDILYTYINETINTNK